MPVALACANAGLVTPWPEPLLTTPVALAATLIAPLLTTETFATPTGEKVEVPSPVAAVFVPVK